MRKDDEIFKDVSEKLRFDPSIRENDILVSVKEGIVTLTGNVNTYIEKVLTEDVVKSVQGVKGIAEDLEVSLASQRKRSDTDIARAAIHALDWDVFVPYESIKVTVENGIVTLSGHVSYNYERESAIRAVHSLQGVKNVINMITIKPSVSPLEVKEKIARDFERNARIDAGNVNVLVEGAKVTLKGKVRAWAEHEEASKIAWSIPGVIEVDNQIRLY